ncbi:MAG: hypothetical protein ACXWE7_12975 [Nitrososphaeraceae archaeon]
MITSGLKLGIPIILYQTMKNILIIDDDVKTSSKYKKWLEGEEGFNSTLINDPQTAELILSLLIMI